MKVKIGRRNKSRREFVIQTMTFRVLNGPLPFRRGFRQHTVELEFSLQIRFGRVLSHQISVKTILTAVLKKSPALLSLWPKQHGLRLCCYEYVPVTDISLLLSSIAIKEQEN